MKYQIIITFVLVIYSNATGRSPVIGILTQPAQNSTNDAIEVSVAASYVKWLEAAGAVVVPLPHYHTPEQVQKLMKKLNGVLIMGGANALFDDNGVKSEFQNQTEVILDYAYDFNKNGDYFPVWGTCLGFESIMYWATDDDYTFLNSTDWNDHHGIEFVRDIKSPIKDFLGGFFTTLSENNYLYFNHDYYFSPDLAKNYSFFNETFRIPATSILPNEKKEMIAIIEGKNYPIYGSMFHPEKNQFEHNFHVNIAKDFHAILLSQMFANYFVDLTRKSNHEMSIEETDQRMIFNYPPTRTHGAYTLVYDIPKKELDDLDKNL